MNHSVRGIFEKHCSQYWMNIFKTLPDEGQRIRKQKHFFNLFIIMIFLV